MKHLLICIFLALSVPIVFVLFSQHRISSHWEHLESKCEAKTREYLTKKGSIPTAWIPSMKSTAIGHVESDVTSLHGSWRVGKKQVRVLCSARVGSVERMGYEIDYPQ